MSNSQNLNRCYGVLIAGCLVAILYYLLMVQPLDRQERRLDDRGRALSAQLGAAGHGRTLEEVRQSIRTVESDLAAFAEIGRDRTQTIQFAPEVTERINRPFQLIDFEEQRFQTIAQVRALAAEHKVELFEGWEQRLPGFETGMDRPFLLWVRLGVIEQLLRAAIAVGVDRIDGFDLDVAATSETVAGEAGPHEVPVRMQITGKMQPVHNIMMALPLRGDEMSRLDLQWGEGPKSIFFLSRFILKKSSRENADEVSLDFVASGYIDLAPAL
jgi:hypothetical protein